MKYVRRFVFVHFQDLLELRFKQLEKVTDKLYVFIPKSVEQVPIRLVRQMQAMGPDVEWIELDTKSRKAAVSILSFHVGILHEKIDLGVEFAILSDDAALDELVSHIDASGRTCVRVKQRLQSEDSVSEVEADDSSDDIDLDLDLDFEGNPNRGQGGSGLASAFGADERNLRLAAQRQAASSRRSTYEDLNDLDEVEQNRTSTEAPMDLPEGFQDYQTFVSSAAGRRGGNGAGTSRAGAGLLVETRESGSESVAKQPNMNGFDAKPLADELVRRLIRSGNRPAELSTLRSYIVLHTDDADAAQHVDAIIEQMIENGEVRVNDGSVAYSF